MLKYLLFDNGNLIERNARELYNVKVSAIAKHPVAGDEFEFANEYICQELARVAQLPCARNEDAERNGEACRISFRSTVVSPEALPPMIDAEALVKSDLSLATGIVLFDLWVRNWDRHHRNLAFNETTGQIVIFDHGSCPFTMPDPLKSFKSTVDSFGIASHCLVKSLHSAEYFEASFADTNGIHRVGLAGSLKTVRIKCGHSEECLRFLLRRRARLFEIILENLEEFSSFSKFAESEDRRAFRTYGQWMPDFGREMSEHG